MLSCVNVTFSVYPYVMSIMTSPGMRFKQHAINENAGISKGTHQEKYFNILILDTRSPPSVVKFFLRNSGKFFNDFDRLAPLLTPRCTFVRVYISGRRDALTRVVLGLRFTANKLAFNRND